MVEGSYEAILEGIVDRLNTIGSIAVLLDYEPTAIQDTPLVYMLLDRTEREKSGQLTAMRYRVLCRLCVPWMDNEEAERELIPFVNSIPAAIDADPTLGGRVTRGRAYVSEQVGVFVSIGGTLYRALDTFVEVLYKGPFQSGI